MNLKAVAVIMRIMCCAVFLLNTVTPCYCQEMSGGPGHARHHRGGPPQEAITACQDMAEGDDCQFQTPRGEIEGTCQSRRNQLICVPENRIKQDGRMNRDHGSNSNKASDPGKQRDNRTGQDHAGLQQSQPRDLPPEAKSACSNKNEGDSCQFQSPRGRVNGTCTLIHGALGCLPDRRPHQDRPDKDAARTMNNGTTDILMIEPGTRSKAGESKLQVEAVQKGDKVVYTITNRPEEESKETTSDTSTSDNENTD